MREVTHVERLGNGRALLLGRDWNATVVVDPTSLAAIELLLRRGPFIVDINPKL